MVSRISILIFAFIVGLTAANHCYRCLSSGEKGACWKKQSEGSRNSTCANEWCVYTIQKLSDGDIGKSLTARSCAVRSEADEAKSGCVTKKLEGKSETKCFCKGDFCNKAEITIFKTGNPANKFIA